MIYFEIVETLQQKLLIIPISTKFDMRVWFSVSQFKYIYDNQEDNIHYKKDWWLNFVIADWKTSAPFHKEI